MYRLKSEVYPRNITLSQEEHKEIYPDRVPRRITYLFDKKSGITIPMPDEIATYLSRHYDVKMLGDKGKIFEDDLDEMSWTDLQKLGRAMNKAAGEPIDMWQMKRPDIVINIRKWRKDGVKL